MKNKLTVKKKATLSELAGAYTEQALATLAEVMLDQEQTGTARVAAANSLLDRAHGKPQIIPDNPDDDEAQSLNISLNVSKPIKEIRVTRSDA